MSEKCIYTVTDNFALISGDSLKLLKKIPDNSINMIFADPPYFLSNGGITCRSGKMVSVNKADWDTGKSLKEKHKFNINWLKECKRILKQDGTIWVSGTYHNIYSIGFALESLEFKILNNITWFKPNASPNLSCRFYTHSTETIIWASKSKKSKHIYNYDKVKERNGGKQKRDVWEIAVTPKSEKKFGKHPTQKPFKLLEEIIISSTNEGDIILDPFNGSGTTGLAALSYNRKYIGFDIEIEYLELTRKRFSEIQPIFEI
ncbi:Type II DNA methyltransferase M2.BstXII [Bacillus sp. X1(2014)]|nr:Type II DNA methyltransferase M2.BstXII [Bacillus sp. X1(2014)]